MYFSYFQVRIPFLATSPVEEIDQRAVRIDGSRSQFTMCEVITEQLKVSARNRKVLMSAFYSESVSQHHLKSELLFRPGKPEICSVLPCMLLNTKYKKFHSFPADPPPRYHFDTA